MKVSIVVDVQTVSIAIASASITLAAIYYMWQIRHQTKLRQTDLVVRLYSIYSSKEFNEAATRCLAADFRGYNEFVEKYGSIPSETPVQIAFQVVATFFEGVGELLHKKLIDIGLVEDLFAVQIHWKKAEPLMMDLRKQFGPKLYEWFEYLYNELQKRERRLQPKS
jgi:hypothetical protein